MSLLNGSVLRGGVLVPGIIVVIVGAKVHHHVFEILKEVRIITVIVVHPIIGDIRVKH